MSLSGKLRWFAAGSALLAAAHSSADPFDRLTQTDLGLGAYRAANGAPSPNYWQQRVDYDLDVELLPTHASLRASAVIRYHNNSPDTLQDLFFALDHNALKPGSAAMHRLLAGDTGNTADEQNARLRAAARTRAHSGFALESVQSASGAPLAWRQRDTLLQVQLERPLQPGETIALRMRWQLPLADKVATGARSGYEQLADGGRIYVAAQWFPRAVAYTDYAGWQLKPFLQQGEFSTEFGNYRVRISAPLNYTVAASGELQNPGEVLDADQLKRWRDRSSAMQQMVDAGRAADNRGAISEQRKTWEFRGDSLRDFAFCASGTFLWQLRRDARGRRMQLFYPEEAASLWSRFGLDAIDHALRTFDDALFPLPYRSVSVVNAAGIGMEYPGMSTVATRPERPAARGETPPWNALTKYDFIGSIIHEVGHNYLPMNINTDEREWAWLDEGLVSFIEYRAEHAWEANFDVIYGEPRSVADYTASADHQPIMTSADSLRKKIANAYNKTASVLNMLRYLVLDPPTFDTALRRFADDWRGKRPTPGDFFRAMETASGTDLSWFWRSWFFRADSIDLAVNGLALAGKPLPLKPLPSVEPAPMALTTGGRTRFVVDDRPQLADAYTRPLAVPAAAPAAPEMTAGESSRWYRLSIANRGRALLPVPLQLTFASGAVQSMTIPAQSWMRASGDGALQLQLPLPVADPLARLCIDPLWLTPDTDRSNNCIEVSEP